MHAWKVPNKLPGWSLLLQMVSSQQKPHSRQKPLQDTQSKSQPWTLVPLCSGVYEIPTAGCFGPVKATVENVMRATKSWHLVTGTSDMQLSSGTGKAFRGPTLLSGISLVADSTFTLGQFQGSVNNWQSAAERSGTSIAKLHNDTTQPGVLQSAAKLHRLGYNRQVKRTVRILVIRQNTIGWFPTDQVKGSPSTHAIGHDFDENCKNLLVKSGNSSQHCVF